MSETVADDQSAVVFSPDGEITLVFPKFGEDENIDQGAINVLRVAVLFGDKPESQALLHSVDELIERMREGAEDGPVQS